MFETMVTIVGNVATDVVLRHTQDGKPFAGFGVVVAERRYDKKAEAWADGDKMFVWVNGWRRLASGAATSLKKGDPVIVNGRLQVDEYEKDGEKRTVVRVDAFAIGPNLAFCTADARRTAPDDGAPYLRPVDLDHIGEPVFPPSLTAVAV